MQIFLDCDGVLADFDKRFIELSGGYNPAMAQERFGAREFWKIVNRSPTFFRELDTLEGAHRLVEGVRDLGFEPVVLTGGSSTRKEETRKQKEAWVEEHFPGTQCIVTLSKLKYTHKVPGKRNVLVDDWDRYIHMWKPPEDPKCVDEFILHTEIDDSLEKLKILVDSHYEELQLIQGF